MGRAFVFGDNIDTDAIIPAEYTSSTDPERLAAGAMAGIQPSFADEVVPGDIVVAGTNFGCGSSREHAPLALRATEVEAVVAESFARIFFRNAVNIGLPVLTVPGVTEHVAGNHELSVDPEAGRLTDRTTGDTFDADGLPPFARKLVASGGLIEYGRRRLETN